jgi:hypothetical protein
MALDYSFNIATEYTCSELIAIIAPYAEITIEQKHTSDEKAISALADGIILSIKETGESLQSMIEEEVGISVNISILFRIDKSDNWKIGRENLLQICLEVLRCTTGDAILLFNGEDIILIRKNGMIDLNGNIGFWTQDNLALVNAQYEMKYIESL